MTEKTQMIGKPFSLRAAFFCIAMLLFGGGVRAQSGDLPIPAGTSVDGTRKSPLGTTGVTTENNGGLTTDVYTVKQTAEFGGRLADYSGNDSMWGTYVNLGSGARLLEYSLNLHAEHHNGLLFDDLTFNNFGYGGDPNNVSRLQFSKGKLYDFNAFFRRNKNFFDYNLLANPLNPSTSVPSVPVLDSTHAMYLTRRMDDFDLRLLPLSVVRFRLGYSHDIEEGTSFLTTHQGTEGLVDQFSSTITDNYRLGVNVRVLPRTTVSYDQFFTHAKGNTWGQLNSFPYLLAGNIPVDLGLSFNTAAGQPCAAPILGTGFANPACNGFFSYTQSGDSRVDYPTEQAGFHSSYLPWLDLSGRFSYSKADNTIPSFAELFSGLITRTRQRSFSTTGNVSSDRLSVSGDFGTTIHVSHRLRLVDSFRYENFRIPGVWTLATSSLFGATLLSTPNGFNPATCPPPFTAATCPQHSAASSADVINDVRADFLRQERKLNTFSLEYDVTPRITAYLGYRYENREITNDSVDTQVQTFYPMLPNRGACAGQPLGANGVCTVTVPSTFADYLPINTNGALTGVSARVTNELRLHFETQFDYADNTYTRISPRHLQKYRFTANYKPADWVSVSGVIAILENRNTAADIGDLQHNRSYGFTTQLAPQSERFGLDLTYHYSDIYSQTNICYAATPSPTGAVMVNCGTGYLDGISLYSSLTHYGSGSLFFQPLRHVTTWLGYSVTSADGETFLIDSLSPTGPLTYRYHVPFAAMNFNIAKGLAFKSSWNYYDYHEYSDPGPTLARNFRGNVVTLSLRYGF
ncbi:MAG TPA: hypothetical protein VEI54_09820 [Candidatus Limnocylindrales bacterium]|nr:hypothetical protein [Candidatus Limnocylindrales bacterium]